MNDVTYYRIAGSVATVGIISAIVSAILYWMALPIFAATGLSWIFFYGLLNAAVGILALVLRTIWTEHRP